MIWRVLAGILALACGAAFGYLLMEHALAHGWIATVQAWWSGFAW